MRKFKIALLTASMVLLGSSVLAQTLRITMPSGCNSNVFLNTDDPNTIGYDNIVSAFHSTMALQKDGSVVIWGEASGPLGTDEDNQLTPTAISPENGYTYSGNILRYTIGSRNQFGVNGNDNEFGPQFVILTTDGLYAWGQQNIVFPKSIKNTNSFEKITTINGANQYGLPTGVNPGSVNMIFASKHLLAISTAPLGEVYILGSSFIQGDNCGGGLARIPG